MLDRGWLPFLSHFRLVGWATEAARRSSTDWSSPQHSQTNNEKENAVAEKPHHGADVDGPEVNQVVHGRSKLVQRRQYVADDHPPSLAVRPQRIDDGRRQIHSGKNRPVNPEDTGDEESNSPE